MSEETNIIGGLDARFQEAAHDIARHALRKMRMNYHKGHWRGLSLNYLLARLLEEANEIGDELRSGPLPGEDRALWVRRVQDECGDVAAFAAMIADNVSRSGG